MDLGKFYERYKQYFCWKLSMELRNAGLSYHAEDIIHDVVVSIIANEAHRKKFESLTEREAKAYFSTCLTNRAVDMIRRERRCKDYISTMEATELQKELGARDLETGVVDRLDQTDRIQRTIQLLTVQERELLYLVFIQKRSYREIAGRIKIRESAIAMRVARLRKKFLILYTKQKRKVAKKDFGYCQAEKLVLL